MSSILSDSERETINTFLQAHSTLALATSAADGIAQVAPLFYVSDESFNLYWLSSAHSRHSLNIAARPQAAATIYPTVWLWTDIRGLQVEGSVEIVSGMRWENMLNHYREKFQLPPAFDTQIATSTLYVLKPSWLRWLDNSVSFGYKAETVF